LNIRELAEKIGVSPATVSIVLNNKKGVSDKTRQKILNAIKAYEYEYTPPAKNKVQTQNVLVIKFWKSGLLIEENQGFISMIIDSIEEQLRAENYGMTMTVAKSDFNGILSVVDFSKYCGMILVASEVSEEMYEQLREIPIPFVVVDNAIPNYPYNSVCMNNYENVWMALKYCQECGHKQIGYFRSSSDFENFKERNKAFLMYTKELGLEFDPKNEFRVGPTLIGAHEGIKTALESSSVLPKCFFADNDSIALGAIKALKEKGYRVPEDVSVIGFDDIPYASVSSPALTTIRVQRDIMGKQSVHQLFRIIEDPRFTPMKTSITGKLVVRESVKNLKNSYSNDKDSN